MTTLTVSISSSAASYHQHRFRWYSFSGLGLLKANTKFGTEKLGPSKLRYTANLPGTNYRAGQASSV
jgi:hypothetical protein